MHIKAVNTGKWLQGCVTAALLLAATSAWAEHPEVPASQEGVTVVNTENMKGMMESGKALIIDSRKTEDFTNGTIPGSVSCPVTSGSPDISGTEVEKTVNDFNACPAVRDADRSRATAIYCNGITCWRSLKGALALKKMGFTQVNWYREGMNIWKEQKLPLE